MISSFIMFLATLRPALNPTPMLKSTSSSCCSLGAFASLPTFSEAAPRSSLNLCSLVRSERVLNRE